MKLYSIHIPLVQILLQLMSTMSQNRSAINVNNVAKQMVLPPTCVGGSEFVAAGVQDAAPGVDIDADRVGSVGGTGGVTEQVLVEHTVLATRQERVRIPVLPHDPCRHTTQ